MPSRRQFFTAIGSVGSIALAGCYGSSSWKGLTIRNEDESEHSVTVKATGDFSAQTVETVVEAGSESTVEQFIPELDYAHVATIAVTVDGTQVVVVDRRVRFSIERFRVIVTGPEAVRVEPKLTPS